MTEATRRDYMKHGCLTDCVAFYFNVHPSTVPLFIRPQKGWVKRLKAFFRRRGYRARFIETRRPPTSGTHIVIGKSVKFPKDSHAVVYRRGRKVWDSAMSEPSIRYVTHRLQVRRITK